MVKMTLVEAMAMAVLKGDLVVAYALADRLIEERQSPTTPMEEAGKAFFERRPHLEAHEVYSWPEFIAFCRRAGVAWDLRTRDMVIRLPCQGLMEIEQSYVATPAGGAVDTTTFQNQEYVTRIPNTAPPPVVE